MLAATRVKMNDNEKKVKKNKHDISSIKVTLHRMIRNTALNQCCNYSKQCRDNVARCIVVKIVDANRPV